MRDIEREIHKKLDSMPSRTTYIVSVVVAFVLSTVLLFTATLLGLRVDGGMSSARVTDNYYEGRAIRYKERAEKLDRILAKIEAIEAIEGGVAE